jgi:hypothetical protein
MSPNEFPRSCCTGAGCGFAYRDKIDCLRSGRDIPVGAAGVDAVLVGRLPADGWALPKKSRPSSESLGLCVLGGAGCACLGGARGVGSVVLGRVGGEISSPNKSIEAC